MLSETSSGVPFAGLGSFWRNCAVTTTLIPNPHKVLWRKLIHILDLQAYARACRMPATKNKGPPESRSAAVRKQYL